MRECTQESMSKNTSLELPTNFLTDFRIKSTIGVALILLVAITPFSINNLFQGRFLVSIGSLMVTITCLYIGISSYRGKYNANIILLIWAPLTSGFYILTFVFQDLYITYWSYPAILSFYFMLPMGRAIIGNAIFLCAAYLIAWSSIDTEIFTRFITTTICVSAFSCMFISVIDKQKKTLIEFTQTDVLTGVLNRASLRVRLDNHIISRRNLGSTATLATVDIDHFKKINDRYGHHVGDQVLIGVSKYLCDNTREVDELFRIGGEEFLLIFKNRNLENATHVATELCRGIAAFEFIKDHQVTISIGLAELTQNETANEWLIRSDKALYAAKHSGRNRICSQA